MRRRRSQLDSSLLLDDAEQRLRRRCVSQLSVLRVDAVQVGSSEHDDRVEHVAVDFFVESVDAVLHVLRDDLVEHVVCVCLVVSVHAVVAVFSVHAVSVVFVVAVFADFSVHASAVCSVHVVCVSAVASVASLLLLESVQLSFEASSQTPAAAWLQ